MEALQAQSAHFAHTGEPTQALEQEPSMTSSLKGQIAWITGGGSGIGLAGAMELRRLGPMW